MLVPSVEKITLLVTVLPLFVFEFDPLDSMGGRGRKCCCQAFPEQKRKQMFRERGREAQAALGFPASGGRRACEMPWVAGAQAVDECECGEKTLRASLN